jgi:hypothetical protein
MTRCIMLKGLIAQDRKYRTPIADTTVLTPVAVKIPVHDHGRCP